MINVTALEAIQLNEPKYSKAQRAIAHYILRDPSHVIGLSIHEMAEEIGTSASSITRFCRKLGFDSLRDLRLDLARTADERAVDDIKEVISWVDDPGQLATNYLGSVNDVCRQTLELNQIELLRDVASRICSADSVYIFGIGASALAARNLLGKLTKLHFKCVYDFDSDQAVQMANSASSSDIAIAFSYSGNSRDVIRAAKNVKGRKCNLVAITRQGSSPLQELADERLFLPPVEQVTRVTTLFTNYTQSLLVDVLFLLCAQMTKVDPDGLLREYRLVMADPLEESV